MIYTIIVIAVLIALYLIITNRPVFGAEAKGKRLERMQQSKNYKDNQFQNLSYTPSLAEGYSMTKVMYDFFFKKKNPLIKPLKKIPSIHTNLKNLPKDQDIFIWMGHSSYYIQTDGVSFLIDPVLSSYGSPFKFFNKAFSGADIFKPEDIPVIDYLIITHDHYDHLDYPTVKSIKNKVRQVILPLGVGAHLERWGYKTEQLIEEDWGGEAVLKNNIKIIFTPARHFSGRKTKRNVTLWTSYVLETPTKKLFLGGDSGYDTHFKMIGDTYGPFDYAILENGQYNKAWKYIHALPEDVIQASNDVKAKNIIPVHSSKFALALHAWNEPLKRVTSLGKQKNLNILTPLIGQPVDLNKSDNQFKAWWEY
ncbi:MULTISPECIES: MBL fold metallo-hydrolase [Chryseobacterium]|uniref:L-ascorbate metabolism protein UlaG (Beta-lactamase superfamily) n=1 Tax=Chryseobacterium geocarposphaerae TaxID=1416776 RepID=A0ABU1LBQ2_9FLAO|nr:MULTISPECIES: MBL fold metallo-hydrolase [Chryseobacterium]MDR6404155.1 L-ascorbate metabolism protein UlaG (beta-lactamase superfamily) [Chryseobacterium geocarposphaerae]MDR6700060.1 L-ascorbate metabolism protein UlaG (beta-lactamase superfamily) [Chryseobacterium ginsenosidimutans]